MPDDDDRRNSERAGGERACGPRERVTARRAVGVLSLAVVLVAVASSAAATRKTQVAVYFLRGEQLAKVTRPGATPADAVRQLVAGPRAAEIRRGFRTYVPAGTPINRVTVAGGLATVDLGATFTSGNSMSLLARLSQLVRTLTGLQGATKVQLLINGAPVSGVFPGVPTQSPITFRFLQTPNKPVPRPPQPKLLPPDPQVKVAQQRLVALGYLTGRADGVFGPATGNAVLAFQKWERLDRTGALNAKTKSRLTSAVRPLPVSQGAAGKRAEILVDRQVALLIVDNQVVRTIAVSTGKPSTPTPPGNYKVYAKIRRWWSVPFREWLPYALPFVGGIAFHEFLEVPPYPASHGCVRQATSVASGTYAFADVGMPVKVIARS
jgi:Sporulation and spore germination/L,D-transpeptidase catalytic domain/Putative peptidoglycan binding domain